MNINHKLPVSKNIIKVVALYSRDVLSAQVPFSRGHRTVCKSFVKYTSENMKASDE